MPTLIDTSQMNPENFKQVSTATYVNSKVTFDDGKSTDTKPTSTQVPPVSGGFKVRSYNYPLNSENDHYVLFNINLTEESRLIKSKQITNYYPVDNSGQNRGNNNTTSNQAIGGGVAAVGAAASAPLIIGAAAKLATLFGGKLALAGTALGGAVIVDEMSRAPADGSNPITDKVGDVANKIGEYVNETFAFTNKLMRIAASITLYTPSSVNVQYGFDYSIVDETLLAVLAQEKNFESLKQGLTNKSQYGENIEKLVQVAASSTQLASLLSKRAVNKRKDVMFKGVYQRQFGFEYIFAPRNAKEAEEVAGIIFMFKYFAHPELADGYMNFLYTYPAEFDIEYGYRPKDPNFMGPTLDRNVNLNRISSCVLVGMNVNYSPNGSFQTLEQGEPCVVTMSLQFQEIETLHRDRIGLGY